MTLSRTRAALAFLLATAALAALPAAGPARATPSTGVGGPHWYLTELYIGRPAPMGGIAPSSEQLLLVSPSGTTRTLLTRAVDPRTSAGLFALRDWSVDGRTALLTTGHGHHTKALRVDVATGRVRSMRLPGSPESVLLAPDGTGVVQTTFVGPSGPPFALEKVDWSGTASPLHARVSGRMIAGPDDTVIVDNASSKRHLLRTVSLTSGTVLHHVRTEIKCSPVRWWDGHRLLARCGGQLHLVDPQTGVETPLTTRRGSQDYGHLDARRITSGVYVQIAGACGVTFVDHQDADGSLHTLTVPGAIGNITMVDGIGADLVIEHEADCEQSAPVVELTRFDPETGAETPILVLPHGQEFGRLLVHGEVDATLE